MRQLLKNRLENEARNIKTFLVCAAVQIFIIQCVEMKKMIEEPERK